MAWCGALLPQEGGLGPVCRSNGERRHVRAYGFKSNGGPEVLEEIQVPVPRPGPGQVLIEVAYAG